MEVQVHCLCYTAAPEGVFVNVLVGGLANGNVRSVSTRACMLVILIIIITKSELASFAHFNIMIIREVTKER